MIFACSSARLSDYRRRRRIERLNAESYQFVSARILELQDFERRKIARELHDSIGQDITGLKPNLGQLQAAKSPESSEPGTALLSETIDLTDPARSRTRSISHLSRGHDGKGTAETCWPGFVLVSLAVIGLAGMWERSPNSACPGCGIRRKRIRGSSHTARRCLRFE
jgi:hypothetical protein